MGRTSSLLLVTLLVICFIPSHYGAKKGKSLLMQIEELKDFKKTLRTKTNLLVIFAKTSSAMSKSRQMFDTVAEEVRGQGMLAYVHCSDAKKLCKNLKVSPSPLELRHYKDGDFNKNYDRKMVAKSLVNFMLDPTGDLPWDEEPEAKDVQHVETEQNFHKMLRKQKLPILAMFYAPWCSACKRVKPDFAKAATEVKGDAALVGLNVDLPALTNLKTEFNITSFPTIYYFEKGVVKFQFGGDRSTDGIVKWLKNPGPPEEPKPETTWEDEAPTITHLHESNFHDFIQNHESVMVMFYAPWCGHCKSMKPEYVTAAETMKTEDIPGVLAGVDATAEPKLQQEFKIEGFPTVKFFKDGEFKFDLDNMRTANKITEFMKDPKAPPPPPPPETPWEEVESDVVHLSDETFKSFLKKKKHALVMFYAPWCGHCKKAKPEYMSAAAQFKEDSKVAYAAMDCTIHKLSCKTHDVSGYPTFKYFNYGKNAQKYMGGRTEPDFIKFMKDPLDMTPEAPKKPDSPPAEEQWKSIEGHENVALLREDNFDAYMAEHPSVLVMFYAPWCGHCNAMKPAYGEAANKISQAGLTGALAAVDATAEPSLGTKYEVQGYPTLKYFKNGKAAFKYSGGRKTEDIISFMKDPKEAPPPPVEVPWSSIPSEVKHLNGNNFATVTRGLDAVLVMFYAPWCGHCKNAKPFYQSAAAKIMDKKRALAAVDCTEKDNRELCTKEDVQGFPTIKLYIQGEFLAEFDGDRSEEGFLKFINNAPSTKKDEL